MLAYLPLAWVGDHYLNYAQGYVCRLLRELPGKRRDRAAGSARDRADLLLRAAAHLRGAAHQRHHPHGGRRLAEAKLYAHFMASRKRYGEAILEGRPVPLSGRLVLRARAPCSSTGR